MFDIHDLPGLKVTVMGLGLHGGGAASAGFFARHGARVTVTDTKAEALLASSMEKLAGLGIRYVLGRHEKEDFLSADLVIKNPAVPADNPFLSLAGRVETDISVFLSLCASPLLAVTGTKGKSTAASAMHHVLARVFPGARLGGNITISPLEFLDELMTADPAPPVVLELSSWQLGDLRGNSVLKPKVSVITNILPDHQNRYRGMEDYVDDKKVIYGFQDGSDTTICNYDDPWGRIFAAGTGGRVAWFSRSALPLPLDGAWVEAGRGLSRLGTETGVLVPEQVLVPGVHGKLNLLAAGLACFSYGLSPEVISPALAQFPGIEHRLERVGTVGGVPAYNDSAATIPEATAAAVGSFSGPVTLIMGGTDKKLDFSPLLDVSFAPEHIILLEGSAGEKIRDVLGRRGLAFRGPFSRLEDALNEAVSLCSKNGVIVFSPGCASFEMFQNEFDRGKQFKKLLSAAAGFLP